MAQNKENKKIVYEKGFQGKWFGSDLNIKVTDYPMLRPTDRLVIMKWNEASKKGKKRMSEQF